MAKDKKAIRIAGFALGSLAVILLTYALIYDHAHQGSLVKTYS